ncbi:hypothetical protein D3C85_362650 [compost metagenome]
MARLRHAGHEGAALDGVSPPLRGLASDFGKTQSHQRSSPPLVRPPASGSLGSGKRSGGTTQTVHPCTACVCAVVHDGAPDLVPSPRRTRGGNTQPATPRPVKSPCLFGAKIGRVVISDPAPRPPYGKSKLSHLCNQHNRHGRVSEKRNMSAAVSSSYLYQEIALY